MSDFVTLTCPNCSGKLQITDDINRFVCMYCGVEHIVRRGGIITLQPVVDELKKVNTGISGVKVGVDKTASELAIQRLQAELPELTRKRQDLDAAFSAAQAKQKPGLLDVVRLLVQSALVWFVASVVVTIVSSIVIDDSSIAVLVVLGVPIAAAIWYFGWRKKAVVASQGPTERARRLRDGIDALDEEIAQAKRELAKHKQLVRQIDN